jgi:hypothetical protein
VAPGAVVRPREPVLRGELAASEPAADRRSGGDGLRPRPDRRKPHPRNDPGSAPGRGGVRHRPATRARSRLVGAGRSDGAALRPGLAIRLGVRARQAARRPGVSRPARPPLRVERRTAGRSRVRPRHRHGASPHRPDPRRRRHDTRHVRRHGRSRAHRSRGAPPHRRHRGRRAPGRRAHRGGRPDGLRPAARRPGAPGRRPALPRCRGAGGPGPAGAAESRSRRRRLPARGGRRRGAALRHDARGRAPRLASPRTAEAALPLPQRRGVDQPVRGGGPGRRDGRRHDPGFLRPGAQRHAVRQRADRGGVAFAVRRTVSGTRRRSATR